MARQGMRCGRLRALGSARAAFHTSSRFSLIRPPLIVAWPSEAQNVDLEMPAMRARNRQRAPERPKPSMDGKLTFVANALAWPAVALGNSRSFLLNPSDRPAPSERIDPRHDIAPDCRPFEVAQQHVVAVIVAAGVRAPAERCDRRLGWSSRDHLIVSAVEKQDRRRITQVLRSVACFVHQIDEAVDRIGP